MTDIKNTATSLLDVVRKQNPLVHQITNYVTAGDCANATLAIGASPVMADDIAEMEDITGISSALVLNMGTLNERTIASMITAGRRANAIGIPVVFDPVGAGASRLRNDTVKKLLERLDIAIIRGNLSEVSFLAGRNAATKGVDASSADADQDGREIAESVARQYCCVTAITGAVDIVCGEGKAYAIENGHPMLSRVTGTGCMATALIASFAAVTKDYAAAAAAGIASMGIAGELAFEKAGQLGTGSFRIALTDTISRLDEPTFEAMAKIYEIGTGGKAR